MALPTLHGERVTLRPISQPDLEPLAEIIREPRVAARPASKNRRTAKARTAASAATMPVSPRNR